MDKFKIRHKTTAAMLRRVVNHINSDSERGIRRMVDSGRHLVSGQNQKRIFEYLATLLHSPKSGYYGLFQQVCAETDEDILATFGANLLYSSLTYGTDINRQLEQLYRRCLPWSISFGLSGEGSVCRANRLIREGAELGIFAFSLHPQPDCSAAVVELISANPGAAFFVYADPESALEIFENNNLPNAAVFVRSSPAAPAACERLHEQKKLFGLFKACNIQEEINSVTSGEWLSSILPLRPTGAVVISNSSCTGNQRKQLREYVQGVRSVQKEPVLVADYFSDIVLIDALISNGPLFFGLMPDGEIFYYNEERGPYLCGKNAGSLSLASLLGLGLGAK